MNISRTITSNQSGVNDKLIDILDKHLSTEYKKPISDHTLIAFDNIYSKISSNKLGLILDSGCGTGLSSVNLAKKYPNKLIIGVDRSIDRLSKNDYYNNKSYENLILVRADLIDFLRLINKNKVIIDKHYILYPNPYPKKQQINKRWHGHPIFPLMNKVCSKIELRTNWKIYALEFALAFNHLNKTDVGITEIGITDPISLFEKKYSENNQPIFKFNS